LSTNRHNTLVRCTCVIAGWIAILHEEDCELFIRIRIATY